ncbi:MAG: hypothetical protein U0401_19055 [Anaerolineae bacterium]
MSALATARYLRRQEPESVTFVVTGVVYGRDGDEDTARADYLTALLQGQRPPPPLFWSERTARFLASFLRYSNPVAFPPPI